MIPLFSQSIILLINRERNLNALINKLKLFATSKFAKTSDANSEVELTNELTGKSERSARRCRSAPALLEYPARIDAGDRLSQKYLERAYEHLETVVP